MPTGLGLAQTGERPTRVITRLSSVLEAPDTVSGWGSPFSALGTCPGGSLKVARWGSLHVLFSKGFRTAYPDTEDPHFFGYQYRGDDPHLTSVEGVAIGTTDKQLRGIFASPEGGQRCGE